MTEDNTGQRKISSTKRRTFLGGIGGAGVSTLLGSTGQQSSDQSNDGQQQQESGDNKSPRLFADRVLVNGKVAPMNGSKEFVEGVAVQDDEIIAVGARGDVMRYRGPDTEVIDLEGRTVIPGIVDNHAHPVLFSFLVHDTLGKIDRQWMFIPAFGETVECAAQSIKRTLGEVVKKRSPDEWIQMRIDAEGTIAFQRGVISRADLDEVAPNNPVILYTSPGADIAPTMSGEVIDTEEEFKRAYSGVGPALHAEGSDPAFYNSAARDILENSSGLVQALAAYGGVGLQLLGQKIGFEKFQKGIRTELEYYRKFGATAAVSTWPGSFPFVRKALFQLHVDEGLPIRFGFHDSPDRVGIGDDMLWIPGTDYEGSVGNSRVVSEAPELWGTDVEKATVYGTRLTPKDPRLEKLQNDSLDEMLQLQPGMETRQEILRQLKLGIRVGDIHGFTDGSAELAIGILEQLQDETGWSMEKIRKMRNFNLNHHLWIAPDQIEDVAKWNITPSPSLNDMADLPILVDVYGETVRDWAMPFKSIIEAGGRVAWNTDTTPTMDPNGIAYFDIAQFMLTREYAGETWNKEEALDRWNALKTLTLFPAESVMADHIIGSLEVGKKADLNVLNKDYFSVPEQEVGTITPEWTMVDGEIFGRDE